MIAFASQEVGLVPPEPALDVVPPACAAEPPAADDPAVELEPPVVDELAFELEPPAELVEPPADDA